MQVYNTELKHFGVKGMKWGHHKAQIDSLISRAGTKVERTAYALGAKANPREIKYKIRKLTNNANPNARLLAEYTQLASKQTGTLPINKKALKAINKLEEDFV